MIFLEPIKISWRNLTGYKTRSILTIIGMVIGITAVVVIFSAGEGLRSLLLSQMESFGTDTIEVEVKTPNVSKTSFANASAMAMGATITSMKISDMEAALELPNIDAAYAGITAQLQVSYENETKRTILLALSASAPEIDKTRVQSGRFYTEEEDRGLARVIVLGPDLKQRLFGDSEAIGKYVKVDRVNYRVIGVLASRGAASFMNFDDAAYIPVRTAQKLTLGIDYIVFFMVKTRDPALTDQTVADLNQLMRERHRTLTPDKEDFAVTSMAEAREMVDKIFSYLTFLLVSLGGISLLVGGVGIMNVMFVSVRERTYEIGLRKAVGATSRDVLWQFLIETVLISTVAGIIGILLGAFIAYGASLAAASAGFFWPFVLPVKALVVAVGFSFAFGLIFGILPARAAAQLDPIRALRYE